MKQKVPDLTFLKEEICEGCNQKVKVYKTKMIGGDRKGEEIEIKYNCKCEDKKLADQAIKNNKRDQLRRVRQRFDYYSLISKNLLKASLSNYQPKNPSQTRAKRVAERFVDVFDLENPINLLFIGNYGTGKSHLAKSIADVVMQLDKPHTNEKYSAIFISVPKLLRRIRATYNKESELTENDIFEVLEAVDLLILDDIGVERQNDWSTERFFDIIDSRQGMHTIYTTNFNEYDLYDRLGERDFSRVVNEDTKVINVEGENHRIKDLKGGE